MTRVPGILLRRADYPHPGDSHLQLVLYRCTHSAESVRGRPQYAISTFNARTGRVYVTGRFIELDRALGVYCTRIVELHTRINELRARGWEVADSEMLPPHPKS